MAQLHRFDLELIRVPTTRNPNLSVTHTRLQTPSDYKLLMYVDPRQGHLAIFRPGIIAGNAHTPRYLARLGRLIPGPFGAIDQDDIARAFVAEFISSSAQNGVVYLENGAMRQRSRAFK
jgi:hypothetical protein